MSALESRSVSKIYGSGTNQVKAIDSVSFGVEKGEFVALVGPSGSGKTTMLAMLAGLLEPTSGNVFIESQDLGAMKESQRAKFRRLKIGFTFQANNLVSYLTALENVELMLRLTGQYNSDNKQRARKLLEMLGLSDRMHALPRELSGGQQQRVAIARALINKPTVVLLDEPLGALDLKLRNQMQLELKRIQREVGTTFVYVTHDQGEAITMSDHMAVMNQGRVEQIGPCEEIYDRPQTAFVAGFIGETNFLDGEVEGSRNGGALVRAHGLSVVTASDGIASGPVTLCVRPEKIRLGRSLENVGNVFPARVVEVVYQGGSSTYTVELENRLRLTATAQNADEEMRFAEGENVRVGWRPDSAVVIPGRRNG